MSAPLDDITVIEVDNWMAAPSAAAIMADMGANVIKVEPLSGDPMRNMSRPLKGERREDMAGYDLQFDVDNRGKRSIAVALDQPEGVALVQRLVADAEIFLCNLLTQRQLKFGLDPQTLIRVNPTLVHATLTGYGTSGPDAWRPGYDVTAFFGRSGLYDSMREGSDGLVPMARPAQGDHTTGLALLAAVLAALRQAERSGEPQILETSLYAAAVWTQATDFAITAVDHAPVRRRSRHEMLAPTANRYPCGDGHWVVFNMPEEAAWPRFCKAIDREQWLEDERFESARGRYRNMATLVDGIDAALSVKSRDAWGVIFDEANLIWGPVLGLDEVPRDAQAQAMGLFPELEHEQHGRYPTVSAPMRFQTAEVRPRGPSPALGQHTREVLESAGLSVSEIAGLVDAGVVADGTGGPP
jgi:crotonobetainyl-CoA:carnitine CoA-transferase CaiB-like acyl-CoA transferase